jgi:protein-tyrosine phosphatase
MIRSINRRFGTWRGLIRLLLAYAELTVGRLDIFRVKNHESVRRLVFVCLGNICRSAFAEQIAIEQGLPVASVGLSTTTGASSPTEAVESAGRQGVDLCGHRAMDWKDFKILPGDLFLVMEIRQAHEVRRRLAGRTDVAVALLGMWCAPIMPHIHDPFSLSAEYFDTCFIRVRQAVVCLSRAFPRISNRHKVELDGMQNVEKNVEMRESQ